MSLETDPFPAKPLVEKLATSDTLIGFLHKSCTGPAKQCPEFWQKKKKDCKVISVCCFSSLNLLCSIDYFQQEAFIKHISVNSACFQ